MGSGSKHGPHVEIPLRHSTGDAGPAGPRGMGWGWRPTFVHHLPRGLAGLGLKPQGVLMSEEERKVPGSA